MDKLQLIKNIGFVKGWVDGEFRDKDGKKTAISLLDQCLDEIWNDYD